MTDRSMQTQAASDAERDTPDLRDRVAERAYLKAEQRGFEPGHELEDWLQAETELGEEAPASDWRAA